MRQPQCIRRWVRLVTAASLGTRRNSGGAVQGMSTLTIAQIDEKIRIAQEAYDHADDQYGRNVGAQIKSEYENYRTERLKKDAQQLAKLEQR